MNLYINTKDQKQVIVALIKDGKEVVSLNEENEYGSQVLLPLIVKLLQTSTPGVEPKNWKLLKGIEVETGPGSFTGLRVGVSMANALGFVLGIPVNGKKIETDLTY